MFALITTYAMGTSAQSPPLPTEVAALGKARVTWAKKDYRHAEAAYKAAIDEGGMTPAEVVEVYVHLGAARAMMGKNAPSMEAFRRAALLDANFDLPKDAGRKAANFAALAKREKASYKSLRVGVDLPRTSPAGAPFTVVATLEKAHLRYVSSVAIVVIDPLTKKTFTDSKKPADRMTFEVPASSTLPGAHLSVRLDALDAKENRLTSSEGKVAVDGAAAPIVADAPVKPPPRPSIVVAGPSTHAKDTAKHDEKKSGGFWSSPWTYILGGVALAAGGAAVFYVTQQPTDVSVGAARVQTVR